MVKNVIETKGLTKTFGEVLAVDSLNIKVKQGEIYGFLGPNGAGKTTTLKMILGLMYPTAGEVNINGMLMHPDNVEIKKEIGYLPERVSFYRNLTPVQTLNFFCEVNYSGLKPEAYHTGVMKSMSVVWPSVLIL